MKKLHIVMVATFLVAALMLGCSSNEATDKAATETTAESTTTATTTPESGIVDEADAGDAAEMQTPPAAEKETDTAKDTDVEKNAANENTPATANEEPTKTEATKAQNGQLPQDYSAHSAMNSLDYYGTYLPEKDAESSFASVELLADNRYTLTPLGSEEKVSGTYGWDETGSVVHLIDPAHLDEKPLAVFFVGEGFIKDTATQARFAQQ